MTTKKITLHEAMKIVLEECPNRTASTEHISHEIIERKLYTQKDGGDVFPDQIFLRARKYPHLFDLAGIPLIYRKIMHPICSSSCYLNDETFPVVQAELRVIDFFRGEFS